ncbi:hypothetical protein C7B81_13065 [Aphanothece cf. minutissima CCALA 015]|uniref:Uncharacterized protein n=1 Tax=Aphanothece cf. minutissima CCALA 015 TaxID=2107695 RepID=A0ABX5F771_9CHRO|nr:hypothetical protein C7B81_13065 [Aphanothece cf. minutissima CCALA 015]
MPPPFTAQQIALYMTKRRAGSRQELAAAAAGLSLSSAHRIDHGRLLPKAAKPLWLPSGAPLHQPICRLMPGLATCRSHSFENDVTSVHKLGIGLDIHLSTSQG